MLATLKEGLFSIVDFFASIGEFVKSIILNMLNFVEAYQSVLGAIPDWLSYVPAFLVVAIMPLITIQVILRLVGR